MFEFDSRIKTPTRLPSDFQKWWIELEALTNFPKYGPTILPYDDWTWNKVTAKKKHELSSMISLVNEMSDGPKKILDLCAGVAHLSRLLSGHHQHQCTVIDFDPILLDKGRVRLDKYPLPHLPQIQFIERNILKNSISFFFFYLR